MILFLVACAAAYFIITGRWLRAAVFTLILPVVALAQDAAVPGTDEVDLALKLVAKALESKNPALLAPLGVMGIVWAVRKFGSQRFPVLKTDRAGAVLVLVSSVATSVGIALATGQALTAGLVLSAGLSVVSAGSYALGKKLTASEPAAPAAPLKSPVDMAQGRGPQP